MFDSLLFWHISSAASEPVTTTFCVRFHSPSSMLKSCCSFNPLGTMNTTIFQETSDLYHILEPIFGKLFQKIILGCSLEQFHWTIQLCKETLQHGFGAFFFQSCDRLFSLFSCRKATFSKLIIVQLSFTTALWNLNFIIYRALWPSMLPSSAHNLCVDWSEGFPNMVVWKMNIH